MDKFYRRLIPLLIFVFFFCAALNALMVAANHLKLHEFCKEYGFKDGKCNSKEVMAAMARYTTLFSIVGGISILTTGFWAAVSNRLGRKNMILVSLAGGILLCLSWAAVYAHPSFTKHWKIIVLFGAAGLSLSGGMMILLLALYSSLTDITTRRPQIRPWVFISLDGILSVATIVGVQVPAILIKYDPRYITYSTTICLFLTCIFTMVFVYDTTPKAIKKLPIDWARAHIIGAMLFMCPVGNTKQALRDDAKLVYEYLLDEYNRKVAEREYSISRLRIDQEHSNDNNDNNNNINDGTNHDDKDGEYDTNDDGVDDNPNHEDLFNDNSNNNNDNNDNNNNNNNSNNNNHHKDSPDDSLYSPLLGGNDAMVDHVDFSDSSSVSTKNSGDHTGNNDQNENMVMVTDDVNGKQEEDPEELVEPEYIEPGNAVYLVGVLSGIVLALTLGQRTVAFLYLKQEFSISAQFYSNLLTFEAVVRSVGTFALMPLLKPHIKTRTHESYVITISLLFTALFCGLVPFCNNLTLTFVLFLLIQFSSCLVSGFARGILAHEVSSKLQSRILGGITALDVFLITFGSVGFNMVFNWTSKTYPGTSYLIMGGMAFAGAIMPLFISDPRDVFNKRKFGGIVYPIKSDDVVVDDDNHDDMHIINTTITDSDCDGGQDTSQGDHCINNDHRYRHHIGKDLGDDDDDDSIEQSIDMNDIVYDRHNSINYQPPSPIPSSLLAKSEGI